MLVACNFIESEIIAALRHFLRRAIVECISCKSIGKQSWFSCKCTFLQRLYTPQAFFHASFAVINSSFKFLCLYIFVSVNFVWCFTFFFNIPIEFAYRKLWILRTYEKFPQRFYENDMIAIMTRKATHFFHIFNRFNSEWILLKNCHWSDKFLKHRCFGCP